MDDIPFARLSDGIEPLFDEYIEKIGSILRSAAFILGPEVEAFEAEFAGWAGGSYAVGAANGTDALIVALKALGVGPGDKVLVPVNTFIATSEAATSVGAEVDFIDVEDEYYTMDPAALEAYLASAKGAGVKAVVPVHLYGQMADMPAISRIARAHGARIVEDAAQAHGARLDDRPPGSFADIATYSFFPGKNIGAFGDAGAIVTDDPELYRTCKMLVNHGRWKAKYEHEMEGYNMRIDALQAAILRIKLKHIDGWLVARRARAAEYLRLLAGKEGVAAPRIRPGAEPAWHIFAVRVPDRDAVRARLQRAGIETGVHYPIPLHLQPAYKGKGYAAGDFPVAERHAAEELSLPFWPEMTPEVIRAVVSAL